MQISAVIFDLDGTLIDSTNQWDKAFSEVLKGLKPEVDDRHPEVHGVSLEENWSKIIRKYDIHTDKTSDELKVLTYKSYVKLLPEVSMVSGAREFLDNLKDSGVQVALATSSDWSVVEQIFDNLGLDGVFDVTVTGEETPNKKPFPDAFLIAADKLGFPVENCLVIGDTTTDIEAAKSAGMKVIAIMHEGSSEIDLKAADMVCEGFSEITPQAIAEL